MQLLRDLHQELGETQSKAADAPPPASASSSLALARLNIELRQTTN